MSATRTAAPTLVWFREDLRLADHPALAAATERSAPVIPVFILEDDDAVRRPGGASLWWLDKSLAALARSLEAIGSRLILRRGSAAAVLAGLAEETGASAICWSRAYEPRAAARDQAVEVALASRGVSSRSFDATLLLPPEAVRASEGRAFKVFTAFWRAARPRIADRPSLAAPDRLAAPATWPKSERLADWRLHPRNPDWSSGFSIWEPGEIGASARLERFIDHGLAGYAAHRDEPGCDATSRLSPHLHWGEISARQVWNAVRAASVAGEASEADSEKFLAELGWREFDWRLLHALPDLARRNVQPRFDCFPWRRDPEELSAWRRGLTGYPMVDAGMRELWATGFMHNRVRMIAASFLTKHLLVDWREGEAWFWDTLVDADPANNSANWQWVAGTGADPAPYFRIFNPTLQGRRLDPDGAYVRRWVPELADLPAELIHTPWLAGPLATGGYPLPIVDHAPARARALAAYAQIKETA